MAAARSADTPSVMGWHGPVRRPISRVLAEALAQFLPLDAERRAEYRVARAFAGRALDSPALAEIDTATARARLDELGQAVHNGKECGEVAEDLDPRPAAVRLAAVTEGLALHVYRTPGDLDEIAVAIIKAHSFDLLSGFVQLGAGEGDCRCPMFATGGSI